MNSELNSIWLDWRAKVPDGTPNPSNDYQLYIDHIIENVEWLGFKSSKIT